VGGRPRLVVNRAKIMQLEEEGLSIREIAEEMDLSPASVHRILSSHRQSAKLELI
jgi:DNA-directed RNA polymerase specialized sigma24 family protein